jgi:hypothetical protein
MGTVRGLWLAIALILASNAAYVGAQSRTAGAPVGRAELPAWIIVPQAGNDLGLAFSLGWTLGTHQGRASQVSGSLRADLDPLVGAQGEFRVPIAAMSTGSSTRDCHMREALGIEYSRSRFPREHVCVNDRVPVSGPDSVVFPDIAINIRELRPPQPNTPPAPLKLVTNQKIDAQIVIGLSMHGVTQDLIAPVELQLDEMQRVRVTTSFDVTLSAFGVVVKMPTPLSIEDRARVKLNLLLARQNRP